MKHKTAIVILSCALGGTTLTQAAISFVGSLENNPNTFEIGRWSRASVAKSFDIDGNNLYGTDGYALMNTSNSSAQAGPLASIVQSAPSYTSGIAYTAASVGFSSSFNGAEDVLNPGDTGTLNLGYAGVDSDPNIAVPLQEVFAYTLNRDMATGETFRVGIILDSLADTQIGANALRMVAGANQADATLVPGSRTGSMDMYFFDVTGLTNGEEIQIWLGKESTGGINAATMGGVMFDSITVPEPSIGLLCGLAGFGLIRRRRNR